MARGGRIPPHGGVTPSNPFADATSGQPVVDDGFYDSDEDDANVSMEYGGRGGRGGGKPRPPPPSRGGGRRDGYDRVGDASSASSSTTNGPYDDDGYGYGGGGGYDGGGGGGDRYDDFDRRHGRGGRGGGGSRSLRRRDDGYQGDFLRNCWFYVTIFLIVGLLVTVGIHKETREAEHQHQQGADVSIDVEGLERSSGGGIVEETVYSSDHMDDDDGNDDDGASEYDDDTVEVTKSKTAASAGASAAAASSAGGGAAGAAATESTTATQTAKTMKGPTIHRDPTAPYVTHDPFHLLDDDVDTADGNKKSSSRRHSPPNWYGSVFAHPPFPTTLTASTADGGGESESVEDEFESRMGYIQHPSVYDGTVAFSSEGDLFLVHLPSETEADAGTTEANAKAALVHPAIKLTTTVGNVLTPKINPWNSNLIAFTATYTGRREAYLMDLRPEHRRHSSIRLTYFDSPYGVSSIVGWTDEGTSLVIGAHSNEVGLPDGRLYKLSILQNNSHQSKGRQGQHYLASGGAGGPVTVSQIDPVPLSQAIDGTFDETNGCLYFTRYKQSSNTIRYVGGTAEHLWRYCPDDELASPLTEDYNGTSKAASIYETDDGSGGKSRYLLFLSDRMEASDVGLGDVGEWVPSTMNLWAAPMPTDSDSGDVTLDRPFQVTKVSCEFNGVALSEYSVDPVRGGVVLRIGADLYTLGKADLDAKLAQGAAAARALEGEEGFDRVLKKHQENYDDDSAPSEEDDDDNDDGDVQQKVQDADNDEDEDVTPDAKEEKAKKSKKKKDKKNKQGADEVVMDSAAADATTSKAAASAGADTLLKRLPIAVYSDFQNMHERLIPASLQHLLTVDVFQTSYSTVNTLLNMRGQLFVAPIIPNLEAHHPYGGGGMNLPPRRYRVAPGSTTGGMVRILCSKYVPLPEEYDRVTGGRRLALVLATDPLSPTAEQAFYLVPIDARAAPTFASVQDLNDLPMPIVGGHLPNTGGATADGGLGSIDPDSVVVSPCGRRVAWTDTDGRIVVMTLPLFSDDGDDEGPVVDDAVDMVVLPKQNENGEPMIGEGAELSWSPAGRYLAVTHRARNQFGIISVVDAGDPDEGSIAVGRIVQATPARFNSGDAYWGRTGRDSMVGAVTSVLTGGAAGWADGAATTLYFLSDRDVVLSGVGSPWGTRAPSPHFSRKMNLYALPLLTKEDKAEANFLNALYPGEFIGGGAAELNVGQGEIDALLAEAGATQESQRRTRRKLGEADVPLVDDDDDDDTATDANEVFVDDDDDDSTSTLVNEAPDVEAEGEPEGQNATDQNSTAASLYPADIPIDFGPEFDLTLSFARRAYRINGVPGGNYIGIICQMSDDPSLVMAEQVESGEVILKLFASSGFPSDEIEVIPIFGPGLVLQTVGLSTSRKFLYVVMNNRMKIVLNTGEGVIGLVKDLETFSHSIVDMAGMSLSVWPALEYRQMYSDAWRMLRDFFYDPNMAEMFNWREIHDRYLPFVQRCSKREELDDVLRQMAGELSALHVFVYGGEYPDPLHGHLDLSIVNEVASLGASLQRSVEMSGYVVTSIPERDPDFNLIDGLPIYSPLSHNALRMSGQRGLEVGDVIVAVNGESVLNVPDIGMLLRGMAGRSVRLEILRAGSSPSEKDGDEIDNEWTPEPVIAVPLDGEAAGNLRYTAWEEKTRKKAHALAAEAGFTLGYIHLRDMSGAPSEDAFVRGFYPDYDKQALIVDVRHNNGGNIDSWLLDALQRRAWMYWQGRATNITNGGMGWDEQFAFRGHLVVLIDEHTASDGEGFSRGVSELGLGKLIGKRTWGGGIWLSSDNHLVDGGIATAPEIGTYNENFGWGLGIEQMGVIPDVEVDNNPRTEYDGEDKQLETAIEYLKNWLQNEEVALPPNPGPHRDMSLGDAAGCAAK